MSANSLVSASPPSQSISLEVQSTNSTDFPSFTICPDYQVAYKDEFLGNLSKNDIRSLKFPISWEFFTQITHNLTEIVKSVTVKTLKKLPGTNVTKTTFMDVLTQDFNYYSTRAEQIKNEDWLSKTYLLFGRCFSFTIPSELKQRGVMDVAFTFKMDTLVYIHHEHQFFAPDTDNKVPVALGTNIFVTASHDVTKSLAHVLPNGNLSCSDISSNYYDECVLEAYDTEFMARFGCISPLMTRHQPDSNLTCKTENFDEQENEIFNSVHKGALVFSDFLSN